MEKKKKSKLGSVFRNLLMLIPNVIRLTFNITELVGIEARQAVKSFVVIIILAVVFACLLASCWLCLLGLLLIYLTTLQLSWLVSLGIIFAINIFMLFVVGIVIMKTKKNLLFPETSKELSYISHLYRKL